jgi:putative FmdB family regulatory protein
MPIYEYQCKACNGRHEIIQKLSDPPATHCPTCGGEVKKLLSSPAIQFKGSGFYKTDYASGSSSSKGDSSSKGESSSSKGDSSSDSSSSKGESKSSDTKSDSTASTSTAGASKSSD